jgi:hypothetical protein
MGAEDPMISPGARAYLGNSPPQVRHFLLERGVFERPSDGHNHVVQIKRLGYEVIGAKLNRFDGVVACTVGRDDKRGEINESSFFAEDIQERRSIHLGHPPIA